MGIFSNFFRGKNSEKSEITDVKETIPVEVKPIDNKVNIDYNLYQSKVDDILKELEDLGYGPLMLEKIKQEAMEIVNKGNNSRNIEFNLDSLILQLYTSNINKLKEQTKSKIERDSENSNYYNQLLQVECGFAIDINAEIDKKIKELADEGYGGLFLERFKNEMLENVKNMTSNELTFRTNKEIFYSLENYCNSKINTIQDYKENNLKRYLESARDEGEKEWYKKQFEIKFGHPFDYKEEIRNKIAELKEAGYGDILLERINKEIFTQIDGRMNQVKSNDDINQEIFYTIQKYFDNKLFEINKWKEDLKRKITADEANKDFYKRQFEIKFGHPFNSNEEIKNKIAELKEAGYGDTLLKQYEQGILDKINKKIIFGKKKSNFQIFNEINDFFSNKLTNITIERERLIKNINGIMNIEETEKDKQFEILYGDNVLLERQQYLIDINKNEFQIKFGNDVLTDYVKNSIEYLKTFGFSEQTISEEFQKCLNFQDNNKNLMDIIRQIQNATIMMQNENADLLPLLMRNKKTMNEISNIFYNKKDNESGLIFMKDILKTYDENRKKLYASIDERVYSYKKDNMEKSNSADIARSLYPDNDFIIKSAELNDKETDSLNLGSDKPFTEWLNMVKTIKQLENIEIEKKSSHK